MTQGPKEPQESGAIRSGWVWAPLVVAVVLRVLVVVFIQLYHGSFLFLDDHGYDTIGAKLASAWHLGRFPDPSSISFAGSVTYGYFVWVGALYYAFGRHWLVVKLVGALLSALSVLPAASIGEELGGERLARKSAWLVALYPSAVFWGATGLKDAPLAALFLAAIALGLKPPAPRRLVAQIVLTGIAFTMRPLLGVACVMTMVVPVSQGLRSRRRAPSRRRGVRALTLAGLALLGCLILPTLARDLSLLAHAQSAAETQMFPQGSVLAGSRPALSAPIVALLGPFPWAFDQRSHSVYMSLYPGMVVWILLLPGSALGVWLLLRRGSAAARGVIVASLAFLLMYLGYFGDEGFYRQRIALELVLMIVALCAFQARGERAATLTAAWLVVLGPAILVQTGTWSVMAAVIFLAAALAALVVEGWIRRLAMHTG